MLFKILIFKFVFLCFFFFNSSSYCENEFSFKWAVEVKYPIADETEDISRKESARNALFSGIANELTAAGIDCDVEKSSDNKTDTYRLKARVRTRLSDFRKNFHTKIAKKIPFLKGPARISISGGRMESEGVTLVVDSSPSAGYRWAPDPSASDNLIVKKNSYERRSLRRGSIQTQKLELSAKPNSSTRVDLIYARPWRQQDSEIVNIKLETDGAIPDTIDLSDPFAVIESSPESDASVRSISDLDSQDATALPSSFDWRIYGVVPEVRNQGACGSCWAFGTVGVMESALKINGWTLPNLSEQFLISCNKDGWNCDGGLTAHKYHYNTKALNQTAIGAVYEADKPYTATNGSCSVSYNHPYKLTGWVFITGSEWTLPTTTQIKTAIYNYGPITAGVCVGDAFQDYESGVFSTNESCGGYTNHQIILVGWNDSGGYWILRNSWGSDWGESGYMKIAYGVSRVGEGTSYVTTAICPNDPVNIYGTSKYYDSVQTAYASASAGQSLLLQDTVFVENLYIFDKTVTLSGGYDCYYSSSAGYAVINGALIIGGSGSVTIDKLIIR